MIGAHELLEWSSILAGFSRIPADSCVVHDTGKPITTMLASVNATPGDLLLAKQLGCDAYLLHHPLAGTARLRFHEVLERMIELMLDAGAPESEARASIAPLVNRLHFHDNASDWDTLAAAAEAIGMSLINIHLPADELGRRVMVSAVENLPDTASIADVRTALATIDEIAHPYNDILLVPDDPTRPAGKVAIMHAGGTNGGAAVAECLFDHADVGTVVYIHLSGDDASRLAARTNGGSQGSVIVAGHLPCDAIGMNILIDAIENVHDITIHAAGGIRPYRPDNPAFPTIPS